MRRFLLLLLLGVPLTASGQIKTAGDGSPGLVQAQHLAVELLPQPAVFAPGQTATVGLHFKLEQGWHVYWINSGDAGQPPQVNWALPDGITAGPMLFPVPKRLPYGPLEDYGYEGEVVFPLKLNVAANTKPGRLQAKVNWLVCSSSTCLPGKALVGLDYTVGSGTSSNTAQVKLLQEWMGRLPKPLPASDHAAIRADGHNFIVTLTTGKPVSSAEFYPYTVDICTNGNCVPNAPISYVAAQTVKPTADGLTLAVPIDDTLMQLPREMHGLMKFADGSALEFTAPVSGTLTAVPAAQPAAGAAAAPVAAPRAASGSSIGLLSALGLAFLGGILLNLMPCVFPVLFLKGLALVNSSTEDRGRLRRHGLVYALGILVSFWVVVAVLLLLRAGGSQFGWGYQLQSPGFVAVLAAFLFFFALSLAGQFDLGLSLTSVGSGLAKKQGYSGSFFTGVLATVVATPCTGPLMGAAVGFALAQPLWVAFLIFTSLALGLAAPYVLLSAQPAWVRLLPKPGAWMELLKQLTALILFGAVIWLTWIYGNLAGDQATNRMLMLLGSFLLLAVAGWALGRWPARTGSTIAAVVVIAAAIAVPLLPQRPASLIWKPYSAQALAEARSTGKPVFIDFTAAWCLSCQVNERLVLDSDDVKHALTTGDVMLLKADWTRYDDGITAQLASVGRSGVPTYVLYPAGAQSQPDVLPELLTKSLVLNAIGRDAHH